MEMLDNCTHFYVQIVGCAAIGMGRVERRKSPEKMVIWQTSGRYAVTKAFLGAVWKWHDLNFVVLISSFFLLTSCCGCFFFLR